MKTHRKLGFDAKETEEVVSTLNLLLANLHVHYQKLRNFHWNVVGSDFFELHNVFEEEYDQVKIQIDEVAERIRVFGMTPYSTLKEYLEFSDIKEVVTDLPSDKMVEEVLKDFEILLSLMVDATVAAEEIDDVATEDLITAYIKRTEKRHWMLTSFNK